MTTPLQSRILAPAHVAVHLVATVALACLLAQGVSAQDTDDDGVLPATGSSSSSGTTPPGGNTSGGNNSSQTLAMTPAVLVAGELQDEIDPAVATIEFAASASSPELVTEVPADEATFVAQPPVIAAGDNGTGPMLQGSGQLNLFEGLQVRFVAAQSSTRSVALVVLGKDGPSLYAELAGSTKPELVIPLGEAASIDLVKLAALMTKYAELLPGYHATIVFASVESGELHASAVRAHTDGGPLEVLLR